MRYPLIDSIRGLSVIGMMFFHLNYMLEYIFYRDILPFSDSFWAVLGPTVAITFIFLSGFSFFLSGEGKTFRKIFEKSLRRTAILAVCASVISFVTITFIPEQRIPWGIIHFFALSALLTLPFTYTGKYNILFGIILLPIGYALNDIRVNTDLLTPFAMIAPTYYAADWYPLLPWFGYVLIGHGVAYWMKRLHLLPLLAKPYAFAIAPLAYIGRHALAFYMLHAPILYFLIYFSF